MSVPWKLGEHRRDTPAKGLVRGDYLRLPFAVLGLTSARTIVMGVDALELRSAPLFVAVAFAAVGLR